MENLDVVIKNVKKKFPNARIRTNDDGTVYVEANDRNLAEEHLLPVTKNEPTAWRYAESSLKITQNFNRTHPQRQGWDDDAKDRIKSRWKTKRKNKEDIDVLRDIPDYDEG